MHNIFFKRFGLKNTTFCITKRCKKDLEQRNIYKGLANFQWTLKLGITHFPSITGFVLEVDGRTMHIKQFRKFVSDCFHINNKTVQPN